MNELRTPFRIRGSGILRYRSLFGVQWLASVWLASWMVSGRGADTNRLDALFQEALFAEEGRQDLPTAIRGYESVVRAVEEQRRFAATAVFRLGECYRKLGRTNDAVARYRQVLANYPGERTLADLARQNLVALGAPAAAVASSVVGSAAGTNQTTAIAGPVDPDAPLDEERRELEQFERELRDSPDSAQRRMAERLRVAAQNGKFWMAKSLLKAGADPNRSDGDNKPPLHMAAAVGHKRVAQLLLEFGADPNLLKSGQRPLHMAMSGRNISMIEFLLEKGANPAFGDKEGSTLLHQAASIKDNARVRQLLLRRGALVNATNQLNGATPLHYAVAYDNADAVDELVKAGADLNLRAASAPGIGREALPYLVNRSSEMFYSVTPLDVALLRRNPAMVRQLIAAGARYDFQFDAAPLPIQSVVDNRELLQDVIAASTPEALSRSAGTLLTSAILAGDVSMVRSLLAKGVPANVTAPGDEKWSMLHVLLSNRDAAECDVPFLEPFQNILPGNGVPSAPPPPGVVPVTGRVAIPQSSSTPSGTGPVVGKRAMSRSEVLGLMQALLDAHANPNATNWMGRTALHDAALAGFPEAVELLLKSGAKVEAKDNEARTPYSLMRTRVNTFAPGFVDVEAEKYAEHPVARLLLAASPPETHVRRQSVSILVKGVYYVIASPSGLGRPPTIASVLANWPQAPTFNLGSGATRLVRFPIPDLNSLKVRRLPPRADASATTILNVPPNWWSSPQCDWNIRLQWGDTLVVEEAPTVAGSNPPTISVEAKTAMDRCTTGIVTLKSSGGVHRIKMHPFGSLVNAPKQAAHEVAAREFESTTGPLSLSAALSASPTVTPKSDLKKIRITRSALHAGEAPAVMTVDATTSEALQTLLEVGDTVEIPDR